jgi:hypothetical protein
VQWRLAMSAKGEKRTFNSIRKLTLDAGR